MDQQLQRNPNSNADELLLRVTEMMKNQFGLKPKGQTFSYKRPYIEWYDLVALPTNYWLSEFAKFTGQDNTSTKNMSVSILHSCAKHPLKGPIEFVSSPCPCQGQPSLGFHHCWLTPLPIGLTLRRNFIHIIVLGLEKRRLSI